MKNEGKSKDFTFPLKFIYYANRTS